MKRFALAIAIIAALTALFYLPPVILLMLPILVYLIFQRSRNLIIPPAPESTDPLPSRAQEHLKLSAATFDDARLLKISTFRRQNKTELHLFLVHNGGVRESLATEERECFPPGLSVVNFGSPDAAIDEVSLWEDLRSWQRAGSRRTFSCVLPDSTVMNCTGVDLGKLLGGSDQLFETAEEA